MSSAPDTLMIPLCSSFIFLTIYFDAQSENKGCATAAVRMVKMNIVVVVVVVVLTFTHRYNTTQPVVAGQAPITLEWKEYLSVKK